jgi:hypothetical protein
LDIGSGGTGCIEANEGAEFAEEINRIVEERQYCARLRAEAKDTFRKYFSEESAYKKLDAAFGLDGRGNSEVTKLRSVLAYDAEGRHPDRTEQHALLQAYKLLPDVPGVLYFGFPWSTLLEQLNSRKSPGGRLKEILESAGPFLKGQRSIITVCRHYDMLKYQQLFAGYGITHVFWPHAVGGQDCFPEHVNIKILPFPFYPEDAADSLSSASFSQCTSGPCRNSPQLWRAIGQGSIPVVLAGTLLPGSGALWEEAAVFCSDRKEDLLALPDRLDGLARDAELLERKRHALRQLWMLYGPECFIYDIQKLFLSLAAEAAAASAEPEALSYGRLMGMAAAINRTGGKNGSEADLFVLACSSRALADPAGFFGFYRGSEPLRRALRAALRYCNGTYSEQMRKAFELKGIAIEP